MDPYNFTFHLKEIVKPYLKDDGFVLKSTKFTRKSELYDESICFQRSQNNIHGRPSCFYLSVGIEKSIDNIISYARFDRPSIISKPDFITQIEESGKTPLERKSMVYGLSERQKDEMRQYHESIQWIYSSENELRELFIDAASLLKSQSGLFFDEVRKHFSNTVDLQLMSNLADNCYSNYILTYRKPE